MAADYTYLGIGADMTLVVDPLSLSTYSMASPTQTSMQTDYMTEDSFISDSKVSSVSASKIITGTIAASESITVGDNSVKISGPNKTITVNDGTYDVILMGKQVGGF